MLNIHVKRIHDDKTCQGVIEPEDRSWQLQIDAEGLPHLLIGVKAESDEPGKILHGYMDIDTLLPADGKIADLMKSVFTGIPTQEEMEEMKREYAKDPGRCPRFEEYKKAPLVHSDELNLKAERDTCPQRVR